MRPSPGGSQKRLQLDGVVLHHASLPELRARPWEQQPWPFDLGMTAVHEIGHWCGLYHTFQGGCEAPGDDITDTPFEAGPAAGCPIDQPSSCPGETRFNPVENYMDYSDDACMKHFTPQQVQRVKDMVGYYRYKLSPQTSRSSLLEQIRAKHRVRYFLVLLACVRRWSRRHACARLQEHRRLRHRRLRLGVVAGADRARALAGLPRAADPGLVAPSQRRYDGALLPCALDRDREEFARARQRLARPIRTISPSDNCRVSSS